MALFPCHFCSAKPPAGSALAKSFLPGAEVAKKIGMCLVFQHGFFFLSARSTGVGVGLGVGVGWHFSDNHHKNLSELQVAKFTRVWEPQELGDPGIFISQACPVVYQSSAAVLNPGSASREVSACGLQTW